MAEESPRLGRTAAQRRSSVHRLDADRGGPSSATAEAGRAPSMKERRGSYDRISLSRRLSSGDASVGSGGGDFRNGEFRAVPLTPIPRAEKKVGYEHVRQESSLSTVPSSSSRDDLHTVEVEPEGGAGSSWNDYRGVWHRYPYYRLYFLSHICQHMGDWFVRIASLLVVKELAAKEGSGLAHLVLANVLPKAFFSSMGGVLADNFDRRHLMMAIDVASGVVTLGFLLALRYRSLPLIYLVSSLRSVLGSLYYPATTGMVALLVDGPRDLLLANTMNSWAWSTMAILGGVLAGSLGAVIGEGTCYVVDAVTFLVSALLVARIQGTYQARAATEEGHMCRKGRSDLGAEAADGENEEVIPPRRLETVSWQEAAADFFRYLSTCGFGRVALLKATAALIWGPEDIISTAFAETSTEEGTSFRMGLTFSLIGMGSLVGPMVANTRTDPARPVTLQRACLVAMWMQLLSWLILWRARRFPAFLLGTFVRATGSSAIWVNSTLLLQTLSAPPMLGKVLAVEYMSYTVFESASATAAGKMEDVGVNKNTVALYTAGVAALCIGLWSHYTLIVQGGAANPQFQGRRRSSLHHYRTKRAEEMTEFELPEIGIEEGNAPRRGEGVAVTQKEGNGVII
eukprot:CAMPEP_0172564856 /NCGR_PEP_ID=MMETSP1067-20121228/105955_1 /TAXON_ID=265564 ORGANISM="Thalassiosira punctigera, Strain Tpunct2005C2" /NCGR_SAMPLE_ID=MMETSP1067 /ASSEMBLY_ACC=CAM_ASM_000444 /LENGTH=626 /DNA_ID=CAMNT_0013355629 /DNA_START=283 /DNA_END=2163 /DNA_ORIENTATION=-